jgi:hypothetical protein
MPPRELSRVERDEMSATMVVAGDGKDVDPKMWTHGHFGIICGHWYSGYSSTRPSKKRCAARPETIAPGSRKFGRGGGMVTTFTSACTAA